MTPPSEPSATRDGPRMASASSSQVPSGASEDGPNGGHVVHTSPAGVAWTRPLLRLGAVSCVVAVLLIAVAVPAFFVWPPGYDQTAAAVFAMLRDEPFAGFMALDPGVVIGWLAMLPIAVAVYAALRRVDRAWALVSLILAVVAVAVVVPSRPILELFTLADLHAAAATDAARAGYEAAGEALLVAFEGTAWATGAAMLSLSSLIYSVVMLRSREFARATAWLGIIASIGGLAFWVPIVGAVASLTATVLGVVWLGLLGRDLWRLQRLPAPA